MRNMPNIPITDDIKEVAKLPGNFVKAVMKPETPSQVVYFVIAVILSIYALNFTLPGQTNPNKNLNWLHFKEFLSSSASSAVTLVPALSALVLPNASVANYLFFGGGSYLVGLGVSCIPKPACRTSNTSCTKVDRAWKDLGQGFQNAGVSSTVGALLIYMQSQIADVEFNKIY